MYEYHKIDTVFKRDPATKHRTLLFGQYSQDAFEYLAQNEWVFTEKVDGTNIRVMVSPDGQPDGPIEFGGKTSNTSIPSTLITRLSQLFLPQRDRLLEIFPDGGCLYGEGYGAKIQKGGDNYRAGQDFVLFDVRVGEWWLHRDGIEDVASMLGLDTVPVIGRGTLFDMIEAVRAGFPSVWGSFLAEGIVARPACELRSRDGRRIITKIKRKDFRERGML